MRPCVPFRPHAVGRVAYTTGVGIDRPLGVVRINYVSASTGTGAQPNRTQQSPHVWQAFSYFPQWNARGQVEAAWFPAVKGFVYSEAVDTTRHLLTDFYEAWYPYARENTPIAPRSWLGSLLDDKRDKTGLLYRRHRYYDPVTGRFTQEDPAGLGAGLQAYGFASGDPVNLSDPSGLCPDSLRQKSDQADCTRWNVAQLERAKRILDEERAAGNQHDLPESERYLVPVNADETEHDCESAGESSPIGCANVREGIILVNVDRPAAAIARTIIHERHHLRFFATEGARDDCAQWAAFNYEGSMSNGRILDAFTGAHAMQARYAAPILGLDWGRPSLDRLHHWSNSGCVFH